MNIELEIERMNKTYEDAIRKAGRLYSESVLRLINDRNIQIERLRVIASRTREFEGVEE